MKSLFVILLLPVILIIILAIVMGLVVSLVGTFLSILAVLVPFLFPLGVIFLFIASSKKKNNVHNVKSKEFDVKKSSPMNTIILCFVVLAVIITLSRSMFIPFLFPLGIIFFFIALSSKKNNVHTVKPKTYVVKKSTPINIIIKDEKTEEEIKPEPVKPVQKAEEKTEEKTPIFTSDAVDNYLFVERSLRIPAENASVELSFINADIITEESDDNYITVEYMEYSMYKYITASVNGILRVIETADSSTNKNGSYRKYNVKLSVPKGSIIGSLSLAAVSGNITASDLTVNNLKVQSLSGKISLSKSLIQFGDVNCVNGIINIEESRGNNLNVTSVQGDTNIKDTYYSNCKITGVHNFIQLDNTAKTDDYTVSVASNTFGDIIFNGKNYKGNFHHQGNGNRHLAVETISGNININIHQ